MILPPWWTNEAAARLLHPRIFVVPVIGAGLSLSANLPGAAALAEWLADRVPLREEQPDRTHLFGVVDRIDSKQLPPSELKRMAAEYIGSFPLRANDLSRALVQVPSRLIITFNYDGLLHHTAGELGIPCEALGRREFKRAHEFIVSREWPPERLVILHLHGHTGDPDSIVLDGESYRDVYRDPLFTDILFELSHHQTLVFMGTKLDESQLVAALAQQTNGRDHLLLCTADQRPELEDARLALSGPRNYITIVDYPKHDDLAAFPVALAEPETAVPDQPAATPEAASDVLYVPAELRDRTQPIEAAELARSLFELPRSQPALRAISERDVASGHRTLIVGTPGTGKTELLRHIGEAASADRPALIIRMADVRIAAGDARATLAAWAGKARSVQADVSLSAKALENHRYHFLLDGLDEVQTDLQVSAAQLVRDVAAAFPQHAFTLTARPVDALAVFGADGDRDGSSEGWRVIELQPSAAWRDRYFTARAVSVDELEAAMPVLRDLRDLLSVPFFASRAVDLFQEGRLEGLTDLWDLVRALVDAQLEREGPQLMLAPEQVRTWIRSVALAALLAGRRTLSGDELQLFALPGEVVGGTDQLVSVLVQRLLLNERGQRYSFAHRIVGESLAAEALERLEPTDELLAAIVPRRSEALAGVRSDCLVTVGLLCSRSGAWRGAVRDRDPLAAARATPESAELAEREAAERLLWETYLERQVWMWDYDVPGLAEDSEALGRLLRSEGLDELLAKVRRAVHHGTEQDQGNAIRVLSRVNPDGFVDDLRAVLQDPARDGVVRRQAAIAARDLGAHELLDLIVERAATTGDEAEAQDCTYVALAMARDDELLDVGRKLLPGRYGRMAAADTIARRLEPEARIAFAREFGVLEEEDLDLDKRLLLDAVEELAARRGRATPANRLSAARDPRRPTTLRSRSMADAETIFNAAYAAVRADADSDELRELLTNDPPAALRGIKQALADGAEWWQTVGLTNLFTVEDLQRADVGDELLERV